MRPTFAVLRAAAALLAPLVAMPAPGWAQSPPPGEPSLVTLSPVSAPRGATVTLTCTGKGLSGTAAALFASSPLPQLEPATPDRGLAATVLEAAEAGARLEVKIAADAPAGTREIRLATPQGVTNPLAFTVSDQPDTVEKEPNDAPAAANPVTLPTTVVGTITNPQRREDTDHFRFAARRGERMVFEVDNLKHQAPKANRGRGLIYLDSYLTLFDARGTELAASDDAVRTDARLTYTFTQDGDYTIQIRDLNFDARPDFHYRLTIGPRPVVQAIFPSGGQRNTRGTVTLLGFNLDGKGATTLSQPVDFSQTADVQPFRLSHAGGVSTAVPLFVSPHAEIGEREPNDSTAQAQAVTVPVTITGRADSPYDVDTFRFLAQSRQRLIYEVQAGKLGSPFDPHLTISETTGKMLRQDDDAGGLPDARVDMQMPSTDDFVVRVRNLSRSDYGPLSFYRLTIRPPNPRVALTPPEPVVIRRGQPASVKVQIQRLEGFNGEVSFGLGAAAELVKVTSEPLTLKPNENSGTLKVSASPMTAAGPHLNLTLRASGKLNNRDYQVSTLLPVVVIP